MTLLTSKRFPDDNHISNKSKLVEMAIIQYLGEKNVVCLNNCTDANHGYCDLTSFTQFLLGTCKCQYGWKGNDCSEQGIHLKFSSSIQTIVHFSFVRTIQICKPVTSVQQQYLY